MSNADIGMVVPVEVAIADMTIPVEIDTKIALATNLQEKTGIVPLEESQLIVADRNYDGLISVGIEPIPSRYVVPEGTKLISENGDEIDVRHYDKVTVDVPHGRAKNLQIYYGHDSVSSAVYKASLISLTITRTGTYKASWTAWRSSASGTMGTNLYVNGVAGVNNESFIGPYGQLVNVDNLQLSAGDVVTVYGKSGSTSRAIYISNLILEQTE